MRAAIFLALTALGTSTATAQTELYFATGVDSTGRALAQSNADGHVLIESPQYPHGLWLHLVDEAGNELADIRVEYQGRADGLVAIRCVDPTGGVRETLVWTWPEGDPVRLMMKPSELIDLPAGLVSIDWQIDPSVESQLELEKEIQLIGWEAVAAFLRNHWQDQAERVVVQIDTHTALAIDLGHPESIKRLVDYLQDQVRPPLGAINDSTLQILLNAQVFKSDLVLLEGVIILSTSFILVFEDSGLEKWVLRALNRLKGPITLQEAASLTRFSISDSTVHSLAGIEHLVTLETLALATYNITDVSPLAALTNLKELDLFRSQVADVSPLAGLTKLEWLRLVSNQITDVNPLATLTNLKSLSLSNNRVADVSPLADLTKLESLRIFHNQLSDVNPLATLTNLKSLHLVTNQIADVSPLADLNKLESLHLNANQISNVNPLATLTNLKSLSLFNNRVADVSPLADLNKLGSLDLGYNQIADVNSLATLTNLSVLSLWRNQLSDVNPLATLTNLLNLNLAHNQLSDVNPLATLTKLERLNLEDNQITDVNPLATLTNLRVLYLKDNQIKDISSLVANTGLGGGDAVYLRNNPLSDQALNEHIPALKARGVGVTY
ncbi:MAG: leucine-rich repeat domain-containing protein [Gemmatimonadota bacterium]|nr:leucine-rich repeat domain-containing protein [Gemmatimonadota bacterium]